MKKSKKTRSAGKSKKDEDSQMHTVRDIINLFMDEFGPVLDKFVIVNRTFAGITADIKDQELWKPGCYVWWTPRHGVVKVGRSLENARKRALDHVDAQLQCADFNMADLAKPEIGARLLLFNIWPSDARCGSETENNDKALAARHWAAAVEIFLEDRLKPLIRSKREG